MGLNPYYDGCASRLTYLSTLVNEWFSLNPYYDGCASRLPTCTGVTGSTHLVLILIMMDAPLGCIHAVTTQTPSTCLNPYYDGCASRLLQVNY